MKISEFCVEELRSIVDSNVVCDYYGFPENALAFGYSKKGSHLEAMDVQNMTWILRLEPSLAILISWNGDMTREAYDEGRQMLSDMRVRRFGALPSFRIPSHLPNVGKAKVFISTRSCLDAKVGKVMRWRIRKALRTFTFDELPRTYDGEKEALSVLFRWLEEAKKRHFMVSYGHYQQVIKCHRAFPNSHLFLMKNKGDTCGLVGGYIDPQLNNAVIVEAKHDYRYKGAGDALWAFWSDYVHNTLGITLCNCGDTADYLKMKLGFEPRDALFLKRSKINRETRNPKLSEAFG